MFLRRKNKKSRGIGYGYWHLCETVRTARGPRQRIVASLGKLDEREIAGLRDGWDDLTELLRGETSPPAVKTAELPGLAPATPPTPSAPSAQWERADVGGLRVERTRDFGESYLGLALWHRLKLDELLAALLPAGRESVAWSHVGALLTVARFCAQRSELGAAEHWYDTTALDDLLGIDTTAVNDARLYRALDQLGEHKDALCAHLMARYRQWFGVRFEFLLYDVTSTYFEGQAERNPQAQRGYSRDSRGDCKQVCIGLVCTPEGLPLSFGTFADNRADVTTSRRSSRPWKLNTAWPNASGSWTAACQRGDHRVFARTPSALPGRHTEELAAPPRSGAPGKIRSAGSASRAGSALRRAPRRAAGRKICRLPQRSARGKRTRRAPAPKRGPDRGAREDRRVARPHAANRSGSRGDRRIGRALGKFPSAAAIVHATVQRDAAGRALGLQIASAVDAGQKAHRQKGAYLLRTNCEETVPAQLWRWYIQLTQAEAAFRTAKSDLGLRPEFHYKEDRVQAHLLVCFLALALWRTLEQWMRAKGLGTCARQLVKQLAGIKSVDELLPVLRGTVRTELRLRVVAIPEAATAHLLAHLGLRLPKGPRIIANAVPKNTSESA